MTMRFSTLAIPTLIQCTIKKMAKPASKKAKAQLYIEMETRIKRRPCKAYKASAEMVQEEHRVASRKVVLAKVLSHKVVSINRNKIQRRVTLCFLSREGK